MAERLLLLDSNSIMHRAYHALPNLKTSSGKYSGAIYGFLTILLKIIKEYNPTHIAAAFDLKGPTFRHKMYDGYKATRKPMDEELRQQVEPIKTLIKAMGITLVAKEGFEGDDILGTLSKKFDIPTYIVTGDRDSFQLVSDSTKIIWTKKGVTEIEVYDPARLLEDGFTVEQFIDYKALRGDTSDNIPGISGVGEKTAKQLLDTYGSLDSIFEHANEISGKIGDTIRNSKDIAYLSKELSIIKTDVDLDVSLNDLLFNPVYKKDVRDFLSEYEMTSLASRMQFDQEEETISRVVDKEIVEITTEEEIDKYLKGNIVSIYIAENVSFAVDEKHEYIIKCVQDLFGLGLSFDDAIYKIKECIKGKELVCYDYKSLSKQYGISSEKFFDLMIAAHLTRDSATIKSLEQVLGVDGYDAGAVEMFVEAKEFKKALKDKDLEELFYNVETPLCSILLDMENTGVCVSMESLKALEKEYEIKLNDLTNKIYEVAGFEFNIASPKQLGEVLFDKLLLPHGKKTKTGYSVNEDVLESLKDLHPIISCILEYRHYAKLQSTYIVGLQPLVNRGRIHTEYNQCITTTGRLSSTNPNLQNIPARSEESKDIKESFIPTGDNVLISADYSQIELRLMAHFSQEPQLVDAFNNDDDIHALTASQIFNVDLKDVTPSMRRDAKAVNFGIIYGISGFGLANNLSIPQYKARDFINDYFVSHPMVKSFMDNCIEDARNKGYSITLLNRRRNLSDLKASNYMIRSSAERMAMNTPLQGSAADIIKIAMIKVYERLKGMKSKMILQIHDELIIDTAKDEIDQVKTILKEEMEGAVKLSVPLVVSISVGTNWGELK